MRADYARLSQKTDDLDRRVKVLDLENAKFRESAETGELATGKLKSASAKADRITQRMAGRIARNASRNLGSMVLEGVPVVGVLTISGVTALEIHDACANIKDMAELRSAFGLEPEQSLADEICGYVVPMPPLLANLMISQCETHARSVEEKLGHDAAKAIWQSCECIRLPDGCVDGDLPSAKISQQPALP